MNIKGIDDARNTVSYEGVGLGIDPHLSGIRNLFDANDYVHGLLSSGIIRVFMAVLRVL
jgi:hypothetical protein